MSRFASSSARADLAPASRPMSQNVPECPTAQILDPAPAESPFESHLAQLSAEQVVALEMLMLGYADSRVAEAVRATRRTIYRWRTCPGPFRSEFLARRQALLAQADQRLRDMVHPSLDVLRNALDNPATSLRAAIALLRLARHHSDDQP